MKVYSYRIREFTMNYKILKLTNTTNTKLSRRTTCFINLLCNTHL